MPVPEEHASAAATTATTTADRPPAPSWPPLNRMPPLLYLCATAHLPDSLAAVFGEWVTTEKHIAIPDPLNGEPFIQVGVGAGGWVWGCAAPASLPPRLSRP